MLKIQQNILNNEQEMSFSKSIATFGGFTFISRITGFLRDVVLANFLGAGLVSDAFFVSFKLPNLFRSLFGEGAFNSAFVPIISSKLNKSKKQAVEFSSNSLSLLTFILAIFIVIFELLMPYVVAVIAPGFAGDSEKMALAVILSRITFPFLLFVSIVSFQSGVLNALGRFAAPAAAPVILNLLMIASIFIFVPFAPSAAHGIAIGVTVAGFIEILWLNYFLRKENFFLRPRFDIFNIFKDKDIKTLLKRVGPGILGSGIYQINVTVSTIIASLIGTGAISWLYYATRIQQLPLGIVGAAIGVALLPILSKHINNDEEKEAFRMQDKAIEIGALLSIPSTVAMIVLAKASTNILFQHGRFGEFETEMTYRAIIALAFGLPFFTAVKALSQNMFARGDTKTPVKYGLVSFIANVFFSLVLMKPFGHIGIAWASTISAIVSCWAFYFGLKKRGYWELSPALGMQVFKISLASIIMGIALFFADLGLDVWLGGWLRLGLLIKLFIFGIMCILGLATFIFSAKILGVPNIDYILNLIKRGRKHV